MQTDAASIRRTNRYRVLMESILNALPCCCDPLGRHNGQLIKAVHVHHIQPLLARPDLALVRGNLAPLCLGCHMRQERDPNPEACYRACLDLAESCGQDGLAGEYREQWDIFWRGK